MVFVAYAELDLYEECDFRGEAEAYCDDYFKAQGDNARQTYVFDALGGVIVSAWENTGDEEWTETQEYVGDNIDDLR